MTQKRALAIFAVRSMIEEAVPSRQIHEDSSGERWFITPVENGRTAISNLEVGFTQRSVEVLFGSGIPIGRTAFRMTHDGIARLKNFFASMALPLARKAVEDYWRRRDELNDY